jgi:hypothetical protein
MRTKKLSAGSPHLKTTRKLCSFIHMTRIAPYPCSKIVRSSVVVRRIINQEGNEIIQYALELDISLIERRLSVTRREE